jgi:hypothetical protein
VEHLLLGLGKPFTKGGNPVKGSRLGRYKCSCGALGISTGSDQRRRAMHSAHAQFQTAMEREREME